MNEHFVLKVTTESNKKFILILNTKSTVNDLISETKKYFAHYFNVNYYIKYIFTSDKFVIFKNCSLSLLYKNNDMCYIKGQEGEEISLGEKFNNEVKYDYNNLKRQKNNKKDRRPIILEAIQRNECKQDLVQAESADKTKRRKSITFLEDKQELVRAESNKYTRNEDQSALSGEIRKLDKSTVHDVDNKKELLTKSQHEQPQEGTNKTLCDDRHLEDRIFEVATKQNKTLASSPKSKQSNKDKRNYNVKNGISLKAVTAEEKIKSKEPLCTSPSIENLFTVEQINVSNTQNKTIKIEELKQIKKKKKIDYSDM